MEKNAFSGKKSRFTSTNAGVTSTFSRAIQKPKRGMCIPKPMYNAPLFFGVAHCCSEGHDLAGDFSPVLSRHLGMAYKYHDSCAVEMGVVDDREEAFLEHWDALEKKTQRTPAMRWNLVTLSSRW